MSTINIAPIALTGDRPTGPLHLGHYAGSLQQRLRLQDEGYRSFVMIADMQAYTDNAENTAKIRDAIPQVVSDYLAIGLDPSRTTIFLQSAVPELAELTMLYMNFITVSRLERNPTIRDELKKRDFERDIPSGFLCYPVSQAADITAFKATCIPVGDDQLPMIELAQEVARKINRAGNREILPTPKSLLSKVTRLPGIDGKAKASKSLGNAIFLHDSQKEVKDKVMAMYTDPNHLLVSDPGQVEGNVVFSYLDAFEMDQEKVEDLKKRYRAGGLGDVTIKKELITSLERIMMPIRDQRAVNDIDFKDIIRQGSKEARDVAAQTLSEVKDALGVFSL
jgi:tryptophanyl-tRNA synthetase